MKAIKPLSFKEIQNRKANMISTDGFDIALYQEKIDQMKLSSDQYDGVGIASVQIDIWDNILIFKRTPDAKEYTVLFNCKILEKSKEVGVILEGCLSIPKVQMPVKRHKWIVVEYFDGKQTTTERFEDFAAVVLQHEIAHLEGRTLFDDTLLNREQKRKILKRF